MLTIQGIPATLRVLDDLPRKQQKRVLPKAVRSGGAPFLKASRLNAPSRNRIFKRSLIMVIRRYRAGALAVIGQDKSKVETASQKKRRRAGGISGKGNTVPIHLVENPTKAHEVFGSPLAFGWDQDEGEPFYRPRVRTKGTRGSKFMRKSARQAESASVQKFTEKLRTEILIEAGKLR